MSANAGTLLWNRKNITIGPAATPVDTGLCQTRLNFEGNSIGEPSLGIPGVVAPAPGSLPASRVQVLPMAPTSDWGSVRHSEPWFNTATNTVFVTFWTANETEATINVLFWDPHSAIGPGQADAYNAPLQ
jgi:hypothetical protein